MIGPQAHWLPDGRRLHLQHGPIDLILAANGAGDTAAQEVQNAFEAAVAAFDGLLEGLVDELPLLRRACPAEGLNLQGPVARRMERAVRPLACLGHFITPMAAVAGAVAEEVLAAMVAGGRLRRAFVNNGGDIAYHLAAGESYRVALVQQQDLNEPGADLLHGQETGRFNLQAADPWRGLATSGRGGRSLSLGIADSVTVLARTTAQADAAATLIGNAVDLPGDPAITRQRACELDPDSDLGQRLVVTDCAALPDLAVAQALAQGRARAEELRRDGLIEAAVLVLQGKMVMTAIPARQLSQTNNGVLGTQTLKTQTNQQAEPIGLTAAGGTGRKVAAHA